MSHKAAYIHLCASEMLPLQMQPFWLDIVAQKGEWDVCLAQDGAGRIIGALPYCLFKNAGIKAIKMPPFTDYIGPWLRFPDESDMKLERYYTRENRLLADLIDQLPPVAYFVQQYYPTLDNWLPFYWKNFRQTSLYTFTFENLADLPAIHAGFKRTVRTDIKKAAGQVHVVQTDDLDRFVQVNQASFSRKGLNYPFDRSILQQLDTALAARQQRLILLANDRVNGKCHAGLYMVWDHQTAYWLLSGIDAWYKNSAALNLLYWTAIQQAAERGLQRIDCCGSILPGIEHVMRALGATRRPHFRIHRYGHRLWSLLAALRGHNP
ncbi:MAG TPA: GNAT family N-acetyltransferase [Saprospiraceae bacterium]|nr:GNAT family N-acetyltransferase [Saprospiraceae bacterium]HMQ84615.1 GNAT family N-acetyltransferase [Saprospiraceae bacterium]